MPSPDASQPAAAPAGGPNLWWTRRALALHLTLVVVVPAFAALFWWQVQRVREGNTLSWAYVFEWPFFAGYAVYLWWKLVHDQVDAPGAGQPTGVGTPTRPETGVEHEDGGADEGEELDEELDEELAAYNRYLAELHATGKRKRW